MIRREYPDVEFVNTNSEEIESSMISHFESIKGKTLYPADPHRLIILWDAYFEIILRQLINESAKQNVPRYAKGEYLDSLSELYWDEGRLSAQAATTTLRCHISVEQNTSILVPIGTMTTTNDGDLIFETTETLYIEPGKTYGDVSAKCQAVGTIGNGLTAGQITRLVGNPYDYFQRIENITTSAGGSDDEDDDSYYERLRASVESYSVAGPTGAYEYWAKSANSSIIDVKATSPNPGEVVVYILINGGNLPEPEVITNVMEYLSDETRRPLTDYVTVSAPDIVLFDIELTYWIAQASSSSAQVIEADVTKAIDEYLIWQTQKIGRDINPSYLTSMLMDAGVKRVEIKSPAFTVVNETEVAQLGILKVINGGIESEYH